MRTRMLQTLCIAGLCLFAGTTTASAAGHPGRIEATAKVGKKEGHAGKHGQHKLNFILKHANEAGLTADQTSKIQALLSKTLPHKQLKHEVKTILSADQISKLKSIHKLHHHGKKTK